MKKLNLLRKTLVTLLAIVLSVTFTFGDYPIVNADTTTSTETSSEKELVQCSDDWTIFKYTDESGNPQFEVLYQDKTVEELEAEGTILKYSIILKGSQYESYSASTYNFTGTIEIDSFYLEYPNDIFVRFSLYQDYNMVYSDAIPIYMDYDASPYILSGNPNYLESYDLMSNNINNFTVTLKISGHLKQIGDLSISKKVPNFNIDTETINASNLIFENHSDTYTIEEKAYAINYSTVTFDLEVPSKYFYDVTDEEVVGYIISYIFSINGLVGLNSENNIENYQLKVRTPAFPNVDTPVESITINSSSSSIKIGESITLTASILPTDATNKDIIWSSSNEECATVDENGIVTAKAAGTVTITATSTDGSEVEGTYTLTVEEPTTTEPPTTEPPTTAKPKDVLVNSINITSSSTKVNAGKTIGLSASVNSDATNKSIVWSSNNTKYATVDANGVVTTKTAGAGKTVIITATAADGSGKTATFTLKINKVKVKKLKLKVSKKSVKVGKKLKIKVSITPTTATNKKVKWSVSNKKYAKINSKGVLTAKKAGAGKTVKVTAKAKDGSGKKATIKIKIKK